MAPKSTCRSVFSRLSVAGTLALGLLVLSPGTGIAEDLEKKAQNAGEDLSRSIQNGISRSEDYLKSDDFHRTVQRISRGAAEAVQKSGNWVGRKLDAIGATGSTKK